MPRAFFLVKTRRSRRTTKWLPGTIPSGRAPQCANGRALPLAHRRGGLIFNSVVEYGKRLRRSKAKEEQLSLIFHTLADRSRREIIELLREAGELKVGDIAAAFSMSLNGVSKHLKVLEKAGLIERRVDGREHWIRVSWASLQQPYEWLHFYHHFWSGRLDSLVDYVKDKGERK